MSDQIVMINPDVLKVHPRNEEFFDNVDGAEYSRLVDSIKEHGVLTPLRVTKDMTLISGHQRKRAAIEAGITEVPVIIDDSNDSDEILMKLIETNFGRMKNDPIKQAKWVQEYEKLKGVRQGSAGNSEPHNAAGVTQADIAKELGVSQDSLQRLKSLLKLDPALQALISDGKITATTGFKILSKLSPEEQSKLLDKLPDDVKFSAKSIEAKIEELRSEMAGNAAEAMQERDKLLGEKEKLIRENNELRSGNIPVTAEEQNRIDILEQERRDYYEKFQASEKTQETLRKMLKDYNDEIVKLKSVMDGSDDSAIGMQNEIDSLKNRLTAEERKSNDLEFQLSEKEDEIERLKRESKDNSMTVALNAGNAGSKYDNRALESFKTKIVQTITALQSSINDIMKDASALSVIETDTVVALAETVKRGADTISMLYRILEEKSSVVICDGGNNSDEIWTDDDMIYSGVPA